MFKLFGLKFNYQIVNVVNKKSRSLNNLNRVVDMFNSEFITPFL